MIRFLNVQQINARFERELKNSFSDFLKAGTCVLGAQVAKFENNFAAYCGTEYCVGVASGLDAITLIFKGYINLGKLSEGDEVLVPANTYIASVLAIINAGLKPVFVDVSQGNFNVTSKNIAPHITKQTKAILLVHLYGELIDVPPINELAKANNLLVVEDAAQAHGAFSNKNKKAGSLVNAAAFSFYPSKNLGALGDGGAITTNDKQLFKKVQELRNYGSTSKYINVVKGVNSRLDELQAAFLTIKLKELDNDNAKRRMIAMYYLSHIKNNKIILPKYSGREDHVFHLFVIQTKYRDELKLYLKENNIETVIHYPIPPHKQEALKEYAMVKLPVTEQLHEEVLSLPISPIQTIEETQTIIDCINSF